MKCKNCGGTEIVERLDINGYQCLTCGRAWQVIFPTFDAARGDSEHFCPECQKDIEMVSTPAGWECTGCYRLWEDGKF